MDTTTQAIQSAGSVDPIVLVQTIAAFVCLGCILFAIIYSFYQSWRELKERVETLEKERRRDSTLEYKFDHILSTVNQLSSYNINIEKRFQYISSVVNGLARSESALTEKVDKVCSTQMDTSLIAVLNDGLIKELSKELSKEDTPNPQSS